MCTCNFRRQHHLIYYLASSNKFGQDESIKMKYTKITNTEVTEALIDYICDISLNMTELTKFYDYEIQDLKINFNIIKSVAL